MTENDIAEYVDLGIQDIGLLQLFWLSLQFLIGLWRKRLVLTLASLWFPLAAFQNSLTNLESVFHFSMLLIGQMCWSSLFPMVEGVALCFIGWRLMPHFPLSKGCKRNLSVLVWWNSCTLWRACNLTAFIHSSTGPVVHLFASHHERPGFNPQGGTYVKPGFSC